MAYKASFDYFSPYAACRHNFSTIICGCLIFFDNGSHITFQYIDSETKRRETRTLTGEEFIHLVLQHALPKGFRRARDYGFLHGNAKRILRIVQWVLKVNTENGPAKERQLKKRMLCPKCQSAMNVIGRSFFKAAPT